MPADSGHHRRNGTGEVIHPICPHAAGQPPRGHLPGPPQTSVSMLALKQPSRDFSALACGSLLTGPWISGETLNSLTLPQYGAGLFSKQMTDSISESPRGSAGRGPPPSTHTTQEQSEWAPGGQPPERETERRGAWSLPTDKAALYSLQQRAHQPSSNGTHRICAFLCSSRLFSKEGSGNQY